jgi:hypothetical protein
MEDPSAGADPFAEIPHDVQERVPQKKSASQHLLILSGLGIMVLGGLWIAAGFVLVGTGVLGEGAEARRGVRFAVLGVGIAICSGGYALYLRGQRRRRRNDSSRGLS